MKAYFRQAAALETLGRVEEARVALRQGLAIAENAELVEALRKLDLQG